MNNLKVEKKDIIIHVNIYIQTHMHTCYIPRLAVNERTTQNLGTKSAARKQWLPGKTTKEKTPSAYSF